MNKLEIPTYTGYCSYYDEERTVHIMYQEGQEEFIYYKRPEILYCQPECSGLGCSVYDEAPISMSQSEIIGGEKN